MQRIALTVAVLCMMVAPALAGTVVTIDTGTGVGIVTTEVDGVSINVKDNVVDISYNDQTVATGMKITPRGWEFDNSFLVLQTWSIIVANELIASGDHAGSAGPQGGGRR